MYGKIFESIFGSSVMEEDIETRYLWHCLIILADQDGNLDMTPEALARTVNLSLDVVKRGLERLSSPDEKSRSPEQGGRRIVPLDEHREWGWHLVNHEKYRSIRTPFDRRAYMRQYMRGKRSEKRERKTRVKPVLNHVSSLAHAEADTDTEAKKRRVSGRDELNWRVEETWGVYLKARQRWCERHERAYRAPVLDPKTRAAIVASIKQHDSCRMDPEQREQWVRESPVRAAGIGLWYSAWHTASDPKNDSENGGRLYCLEPWRPWFQQQNKPDPVLGFAELYWEKKDAQARRSATEAGNGR